MTIALPLFTAQPTFTVDEPVVVSDATDLMNAVGEKLEADEHVLGPALSYDYERRQVSAIFQIDGDKLGYARALAAGYFATALHESGIAGRLVSVNVVEGDDPELLP